MMRVLWIANMLMPDLAEALGKRTGTSGTWLFDLSKGLSEEEGVDLAIACVSGNEFIEKKVNGITYFCIPGTGKTMLVYHPKLVDYWEKIESSFAPDIVHIHGTEYTHSISYLRRYPQKKKLLTIQGIIGKTTFYYWGGLSLRTFLFNRTFQETIRFNGMIGRRLMSTKNARYEKEIIRSVQAATGRTDWDRFYMQRINNGLQYYRCNYNLRSEFYSAKKWDIENCERHCVYASTSAQVPMKGGHVILKAIDIVRRKYPDCKFVFLAGKVNEGMLVPNSGYRKYIYRMIQKLGIRDNVEFVPSQNTEGVISLMQRANVAVIPSAIENASATLREAMHLGVPCIASFRGGMTELIKDRENGFLYDYEEYEYLAGRIMQIFEDDDLAKALSDNAIAAAERWHDRKKNILDMKKVYDSMMEKE